MLKALDHNQDWDLTVSRTYSAVVAAADPTDGIGRVAAMESATALLLAAIESGEVQPNMEDVVKQALFKSDKVHGKRADGLIAATVRGELTLFNSEAELNTVVTLGKGRRKLWRHINVADLDVMDEIRYKNAVAVRKSYSRGWKPLYEPARLALVEHETIEKAIAAGMFLPDEKGAAA